MNEKQRLMLLGPAFLAALAYGSPALAAETPTESESTAAPATESRTGTGTGARPTEPDPADQSSDSESQSSDSESQSSDSESAPDSAPGSTGPTAGEEPSELTILEQPGESTSIPQTRLRMGKNERDAVQIVSSFWEKNITGRYKPPTVWGPYHPADPPMCGDERLKPNNVYYCSSDDYIAWDKNYIKGNPERDGNTFPYVAIAHEWGHAIQEQLRPHQRAQMGYRYELQADCFAGAALIGSLYQGRLDWDRRDPERIANALESISDDLPEANIDHHGTAEQRIDAFERGKQGTQACLAKQP
ncbi:neutral zinc metallopeptidase [Nonomuraea sp. NBC_00507]|uniref:neutral zinc metallopeptidase n=1 Tax=Nonomuraea sp. NBC_00507 TaxID=2976002 RepID=UPI002E17AFEE